MSKGREERGSGIKGKRKGKRRAFAKISPIHEKRRRETQSQEEGLT